MHMLSTCLLLGGSLAFLMPDAPGPYDVAVKDLDLTDQNRIDSLNPTPNSKRRIMASVYMPINAEYRCQIETVPYLPNITAQVYGQVANGLTGLPEDLFANTTMEFCDLSSVKTDIEKQMKPEFPVIIFSPGAGGSRLLNSVTARSQASLGYIVVTIDHTWEMAVVEFPDGFVAYAQVGSTSDPVEIERELGLRTGDVSFVIDQLSNSTLTKSVFANFPGTFDPKRIATYGHSFGGATAVQVALQDSRVVGAVSLDGPVYGSVGKTGISGKPIVLVENGAQDITNYTDFYPKIHAPKVDLVLKHTRHYAFMDLPLYFTVYPVPEKAKAAVEEIMGTLNARKLEKAVNQIVTGLLELVFKKSDKGLKNLSRNCDLNILHSDV